MIKKLSALGMSVILLASGCVKETYDMEKLSHQAELSPTLVMPAFRGTVLLSNAVKESDTVIYDSDKFVRLLFRKDSAINIGLRDYINVNDLVTFSQSYSLGELTIAPFQGTMGFTLDEVSRNFSPTLRNQFIALDDGASHPFPAFPAVNLGSKTFTAFPNLQQAVFASGFLDISVTNNFTAPISGMALTLSNSLGIVATVPLPQADPGQTKTTSIDLSGKTLTSSLTVSVTLSGSPGSASPVLIDLDQSNIAFTASGRNLKVSSGRVIIPSQVVSEGSVDTVEIQPGNGIELERMGIISGTLSWESTYNASLNASVRITLPKAIRNGTKVTETINVSQMHSTGSFTLPNTSVTFDCDPDQPYNRIPVEYSLSVNSSNMLVDFRSTDQVQINLSVKDAEFDYIKGYFGQQVESVGPETLDFGIEDYIRNLSGDFFLANPSLKINYSNSFAIPIEVNLNGRGTKGTRTVDLGLAPIMIAYPGAPANREVTSSFIVDRNNSYLPDLVSLPPESIVFSGSAKMNPDGDPGHLRNNYVYGNSRFLGAVEMELPLELSINNLQLTDTTDNFLSGDGKEINMDDLELAKIGVAFKNHFPFAISAKMSLYDSSAGTVKSTIDLPELIKAAPVDAGGKTTGIAESTSTIEVTKQFLDNVNSSDKVIFTFRIATTGAPKNVRIYSDYGIDFNVSMFLQTKVNLNL